MAEAGIDERFVQDNHSCSDRNVLRGLHYQIQQVQGKLVRVVEGEILDVAVDLRRSSPTFKRGRVWAFRRQQTHAVDSRRVSRTDFASLSERAHVLYKTTDFYAPETNALWRGMIRT